MNNPVRVRIAPSPTGDPHIGSAYMALANLALVAKHGGQFVLRIEDTDQVRSTKESEAAIFEGLKWLGLDWHEGPDVGGPYGPYRQTERRDIYRKHIDELLAKGNAFVCFCTPERLDTMRAVQKKLGKSPKYDGHCLNLGADEVQRRIAAGEPHVVRLKVPSEGQATFTDGVYGEVSIPYADVDMQVLMKADGLPTYHFAVVVDDHLMKITHVLRGDEWISSTPKQILLYQYFGWEMPQFVHLPPLRNADRTKLSKRKNHTSITWFERQGYLPEAVINFLGSLLTKFEEGEEELMTKAEFQQRFELAHVSRSGPVYDVQKLDWFNGRWLRERTTDADYLQHITTWATQRGTLEQALLLAKTRIGKFSDLPGWISPLLSGSFAPTAEQFAGLKTTPEQTAAILAAALEIAEKTPQFTAVALWENLKGLEEKLGLKVRLITAPLFIAIGGKAQGLPLTESMEVLGRALCRDRLRAALNVFVQPKVEVEAESPDA